MHSKMALQACHRKIKERTKEEKTTNGHQYYQLQMQKKAIFAFENKRETYP